MEAVRVVLAQVDPEEDALIENVAVCLTYGVPNLAAARLLEAGMESRVFAKRLVAELELSFDERADVVAWFAATGGNLAIKMSNDEVAIWQAFCDRLTRERSEHLAFKTAPFDFRTEFDVADIGPALRAVTTDDGYEELLTSDFRQLGKYRLNLEADTTVVGEIDGSKVTFSYFARQP